MLNKKINEVNYVVFDLETTGFKAAVEQIIEIGAVKINAKGDVIDTFSRFVKLYKKESVPAKITQLTTITTEQLEKEGEDIDEVMEEFEDFISGCILVAQNAKFDMSFLAGYFLQNKGRTYSKICFDTINFAKVIRPDETTYKLANLVELFNVEYDQNAHHRADYDAKITAEVLINQFKELNLSDETTIKDLLTLENTELITPKQENFLNSLMNKKSIIFSTDEFYTKHTASAHIDILLSMK